MTYLRRNQGWNGTFAESFDATISSNGSTVTMSLEKKGGGDLTMQFSDGQSILDCTPAATIALTAGTDTAPQSNYIYIPQSTKVLTKSTSSFPTTEHIKVAYFFCSSASKVQVDGGTLINQNWNDEYADNNNQGHITHIGQWIRSVGAKYFSGCGGGGTSGYITLAAGGGTIQVNAGVISQMHRHNFTAKDTSSGDDAHVVNYPSAAYTEITNLNQMLVDSQNVSLTNRYYNIILAGVANKGGEYSPLLIKLPAGSYALANSAINDVDNYDDYALPREFTKESSTAFLIARITLRNQSDTTWTVVNTQDLRGQDAAISGGSIGGGSGIMDQSLVFVRKTNAALAISGETKINFNTEDKDDQNEYDNSTNYRFSPNASARYSIIVHAEFDQASGASGDHRSLIIKKNGSTDIAKVLMYHYEDGNAVDPIMEIAAEVDLLSSDYIEIYADSTDSTLVYGAGYTDLSITKIS